MTDHISIPALREWATEPNDPEGRGLHEPTGGDILALVEAVALANEFIEREEPLGAEGLRDALARFDFGEET